MTQQHIQQLFQLRYNQNNWKQFLSQAFSDARLLSSPDVLTGINSDVATQVLRLGYIALNENGIERNIAIYDVTLAPGIILERNRVGLRNLLRKYWKDIDAAFIVYHRPENPNWRFTYVSELTGFDAEGELIKVKTEPKRYTYILGEGESCRTAAERFAIITKKGNRTSLDDVKDAFSVEKLSKSFFDEYKKHYELFCDYMVSKPNIRQTIFNGDEKAIRDFNKKLLGRIVFLYFIQKKGWMGVPENSKWGQGDPDFLWNLFNNARNKDLFYSEILTRLFFDTLNTPRPNDSIELIKGEKIKIPFLNGGLFEEDNKNYRNLIFPAELFENLFLFFNQYNFTIYEDDPNDHTVAVDPEMLGHIFENLLEDNKDKGAYYTPKEIVHYMCQESLIEYLTTYFENKGYEVSGYIGFDKPDQSQLFSANEGRKGQMILEIPTQSKDKQIDRLLIEKLLKKKLDAPDTKLAKQHADEFHKALDSVKICDPAIGSGAFPMGLLKEIFTAKQTLYTFEHGNTEGFDASGVKLNIIQNSIYGVDIEKGAVDIARLRFWLSLVVDEEAPKALPNLDYKIVVGNSLVSKLGNDIIDIDWNLNETSHGLFGAELAAEKAELLKKISNKQAAFFNPNSDKKKLAADIRKLKIDLLINQLQLMIDAQNIQSEPKAADYRNKPKAKFVADTSKYFQTLGWKQQIEKLKKLKAKPEEPLNFFDWKLDFPEVLNPILVNGNGGFDIVIGNPPYVQMQKNGGYLANELKSKAYSTFERTGDVYSIFYELGFNLLKIKGVHTFITSSQWMKANYGLSLRKLFLTKNPIKLISLGPGVFVSAVVDTNILISKNEEYKKELSGAAIEHTKELESINHIKFSPMTYVSDSKWAILNALKQGLSEKLNAKGKQLKKWKLNTYRGILTGYNEAFIIDRDKRDELVKEDIKSDEIIKPILRGREIDKYLTKWDGGFIIATFPSLSLEISKYLAVHNYLHSFQPKLNQTGETFINSDGKKEKTRKKTNNKWFETQDQIGYFKEYKKEKIIWKRIGSKLRFTYYKDEIYSLDSTAFATGEKIKYLTALLNSKLCCYLLFETAPKTGMGDLIISVQALEPLPVYYPKDSEEKHIVELLDKILQAKSQSQDTTALEQQIDNLVYKLYELTYDEVKVIDPAFALTKEEYENIKLE
ncbi:MAG: Eco57I restriction-modification methylase domain-containing protein [Bacteroidales bacterium]|nr:Eco57I restriction-modification methylase domain-containing protein [Bacteroidales bacterium]